MITLCGVSCMPLHLDVVQDSVGPQCAALILEATKSMDTLPSLDSSLSSPRPTFTPPLSTLFVWTALCMFLHCVLSRRGARLRGPAVRRPHSRGHKEHGRNGANRRWTFRDPGLNFQYIVVIIF